MLAPANVALTARRNVPFVLAKAVYLGGSLADLTGYTAAFQIRRYGKAAGSPLVTLGTVTTSADGIRVSYRINEATQADVAAAGWFRLAIGAAALDALPAASVPGGDAAFSYDLVFTGPSGRAATWLEGDFILLPGVTA